MSEATYIVSGMTCAHCVAAVSGELRQVVGVDAVEVDLESGRVTVHGDGFTDAQVAEAVDEAGYRLAEA